MFLWRDRHLILALGFRVSVRPQDRHDDALADLMVHLEEGEDDATK